MYSRTILWRRGAKGPLAMLVFVSLIACESPRIADPATLDQHQDVAAAVSGAGGINVVNVSNDTTSQNETPLAVNPRNPLNMITGSNDWNYNDGCGVNSTFDGGKTWTKSLPSGFIPAITKYTNDPSIAGTGYYDYGGDPVASDGTIYVTWAQFSGYGSHSPVWVGSSTDGGRTFGLPVKVTSGSVRNDQDARVTSDPKTGTAYLTFDNSLQGGKGGVMFVSTSTDRGKSWSNPALVAPFQNEVCVFPPYCFNISGGQFRGPGSYPVPAFDPVRNRLYVAYTDIVNGRAQILLTYASVGDVTTWSTPQIVAPGAGDRINVEMSIEPTAGRIDLMAND